jgi:hypothetical protein
MVLILQGCHVFQVWASKTELILEKLLLSSQVLKFVSHSLIQVGLKIVDRAFFRISTHPQWTLLKYIKDKILRLKLVAFASSSSLTLGWKVIWMENLMLRIQSRESKNTPIYIW